jgi:hypothetical protein
MTLPTATTIVVVVVVVVVAIAIATGRINGEEVLNDEEEIRLQRKPH